MNMLCIPFIFEDLNILKYLGMPFIAFYNLIVKPYAPYFKTLRILISVPSLSDANIAHVLTAAINVTSLMLYHPTFKHPLNLPISWEPHLEENDYEQDGCPNGKGLAWLAQTNQAIVASLKRGVLKSLGIYADETLQGSYQGSMKFPAAGVFSMFNLIAQDSDATAKTSLEHLEIALYAMPVETYDIIRSGLTSLRSLTIHQAFQPLLGRLWDWWMVQLWSPNPHLTQLKLKKCATAYPTHIPHIVRHFPSLKVLLVSLCGHSSDLRQYAPPDRWHSAQDALWKVRKPLEIFHIEHMTHWEIGVMAEIPTRTLIGATLGGNLVRALQDDPRYFPELKEIRIEPRNQGVSHRTNQFSHSDYHLLSEFCQKRGVLILEDAKPTSSDSNHYLSDDANL
jgi:hypothetical protein